MPSFTDFEDMTQAPKLKMGHVTLTMTISIWFWNYFLIKVLLRCHFSSRHTSFY